MRISLDKQLEYACELLPQCADIAGHDLVLDLLHADQSTETGIRAQRERVALLKQRLQRRIYNPDLAAEGKNPFILDSKAPTLPLEQYAYNETRYRMLQQSDEHRAATLMEQAKHDVQNRWEQYQQLADEFHHEEKKESNHA